jgi:4-hydroxy-3-polyprenylbenzoate decarboxylase
MNAAKSNKIKHFENLLYLTKCKKALKNDEIFRSERFYFSTATMGELKESERSFTHLEMTEVCDRTLRAEGPALLFQRPAGQHSGAGQFIRHAAPRGAGYGRGRCQRLAPDRPCAVALKEPEPPKGLKDLLVGGRW